MLFQIHPNGKFENYAILYLYYTFFTKNSILNAILTKYILTNYFMEILYDYLFFTAQFKTALCSDSFWIYHGADQACRSSEFCRQKMRIPYYGFF